MLKELNNAFGSLCSVTSSTAKAVEEGSKILQIKGVAAKQIAAMEAVKNISEAKQALTNEELAAALELLKMVD